MPGQNDSGRDASAEADALADVDSAGIGFDPGSALCGANGRDDCGAFAICDDELGCVDCKTNENCGAVAPHCLAGACVGCRPHRLVGVGGDDADAGISDELSDCRAPSGSCWTSDFECHAACTDDKSCPSGTSCDKVTGECVGCTTDDDCPSGVCSPTRQTCVECISDANCSGKTPKCRKFTGACVECTSNTHCGIKTPVCDPLTFHCRVGCSSDRQCPNQRCDLRTARCVDLPTDASTAADVAAPDASIPADANE